MGRHAERQVFAENADVIELGAERYPVRLTTKRRLRQVDFLFKENKIRGLEQNPDTKSQWAKLARSGKKVMQFSQRGPLRRKCGRWEGDYVQQAGRVKPLNGLLARTEFRATFR